jgi:hypothetical protein
VMPIRIKNALRTLRTSTPPCYKGQRSIRPTRVARIIPITSLNRENCHV